MLPLQGILKSITTRYGYVIVEPWWKYDVAASLGITRIRHLIDSLIHRLPWRIKKIEESIRIDVALEKINTIMIRTSRKSILSWFTWVVNRYNHDSNFVKIDTRMISLSGESILSRFANLEKNRFESNHKINENRGKRFTSILSMGYRCSSLIFLAKWS